ncbi:MAG: hypothetical protein V3S01_11315 [Dehalococcoidia bacterium]
MRRQHPRFVLVLATPLVLASCWLSTPPKPTSQELQTGLILMYPGISSAPTDLINWYTALRRAGIKQAIQVVPYGLTMDLLGNLVSFERHRTWSAEEAHRIVKYMDTYPRRPVTLIGYSGGGAIAVLVAEAMPEGYLLDRVLLFSSALSSGYDLSPALDRTEKGIVHYWSSTDWLGPFFAIPLGTMDRLYETPASTLAFDLRDERLIQFIWTPEMARYGNYGNHTDYLWNEPWVEQFVAPWVTREDGRPTWPVPAELQGRVTIAPQ